MVNGEMARKGKKSGLFDKILSNKPASRLLIDEF